MSDKNWITNRQRVLNFVEQFYIQSGCTEMPTIADCAKALNLRVRTVLELAEDNEADGTMTVNAGVRTGAGSAAYRNIGERTLEAHTTQSEAAWRREMNIPATVDRGIAEAFQF